ncbi:MAG: branched-chain-amino acid aminotransferase [Proteobacteria bacterium]|jgi:branched-chain amino acid aminotransferase|nr:branched-chain-amino acid aminotransferase [Pseudomonadota bacterium]
MKALANINGQILKPQDAKVSVFDRGFLFGDGVYETGRSYDRVFLFLEEHIQRLRKSAGRLGIPVPWTDQFLEEQLKATARAFAKDNIYFRMIITRGEVSQVGLDIATDSPTLVILVQDLSEGLSRLHSEGYFLMTSSVRRNSSQSQDPNIKSSNYLNSILALKDVKERGAMDAVLLNVDGFVTEGTTFSIFSVGQDGKLKTPALSVGILDGITRRHILKASQGLCAAEEGAYSLEEFQNAKEVFIASSVREICPVYQWDEKKYPAPGPLTVKLHEAYRKGVEASVKNSVHRY